MFDYNQGVWYNIKVRLNFKRSINNIYNQAKVLSYIKNKIEIKIKISKYYKYKTIL